jgi:hypothetical protein
MTVVPAMRVNYFDRQFLRLAEFTDEQAYHIALRRRHNLSHHSWGIVTGLAIVREGPVLVVQPGMAVDGYGRELLLTERRTIDATMFTRYGATRLDVWLEYELGAADGNASPNVCDPLASEHHYRAIESSHVVLERAAADDVDARSPRAVPADAVAAILPDTPDDPKQRWPVYLGRVSMKPSQTGVPEPTVEQAALAYVGLNAELIDHPGNPARIEIGHRSVPPAAADSRTVGGTTWTYEGETGRAFAVFVPLDEPAVGTAPKTTLAPTISVTTNSTQIRGTTEIHGDLVLDGSTLVFPDGVPEATIPSAIKHPAIYRAADGGDELRIDLGDTGVAARKLVIGVTKDGQFQPVLEIAVPVGNLTPTVKVIGDLHVQGTFSGPDIRLRTLSQDLIPQLAAMLQVGVLTGSA